MVSVDVSPTYGWVVLGAGIGPAIVSMYLSGQVMKARKRFGVQYPNLYAVPGVHKSANEFNRVQRGHQNYLENISDYRMMTLLGGLKYPLVCAVGSLVYLTGSILYLKGYADASLDVKTARYKKGAGIKYIGYFISLYSAGAFCYTLINS